MNIVFASDDRGVEMMANAIYSVIKNNQNHELNFLIIHTSISAESQKRLKKLEEKFSNTSIKYFVADAKKFEGIDINNKNVTMEAYYRYLAPEFLPKEDRALCMDFDMLCLSDLGKIYDINLEDNYIGAVAEHFVTDDNPDDDFLYRQIRKAIGLKKEDIYVNSGLLLMNLKLLRTTGVMTKFWDNIRNKSNLLPGRTNHFADQTITNLTFKDRIKFISPKYNVYTTALKELKVTDPAVVHFTGQNKPLTYVNELSSVYDDAYFKYYVECLSVIGPSNNHLVKNTVQKIRKDVDYRQHQVNLLQEREVELKDVISDKEHEIATLHRQQRDVRFLAKRLLLEVQIRFNRRAQGLNIGNHLYYKKSESVTALNNSSSIAKNDMGKIHKLDLENILNKRVSVLDRVKPLAWKITAKILNFSLNLGKRIYRYVK